MIKTLHKICSRCYKTFECNANNIEACECSQIKPNEKELNFIKENFYDCVCLYCLKEIQSQSAHNTL